MPSVLYRQNVCELSSYVPLLPNVPYQMFLVRSNSVVAEVVSSGRVVF